MDSSLTSPTAHSAGSPSPIPPARSRRPLALVGVLAASFLLTGCTIPSFGFHTGATTQGRSTFHLWQGFFIAGLIVGGFVLALILWALFRYRRKSDEIPRQTQYHTVVEITYTVVPIIIVVILFVFTVLVENKVDATPPNPGAKIHVDAFQWGWEFQYPGGVKIIGQTTQAPTMIVPTGTDVQIDLKSLDVLHGFYVPAFNFSRYASPGYTTSFDFNVLHTGVYRGQCTQLCGLYHSLMFFNVKAVTQQQYAVWLRAAQAFVRLHPGSVPKLPAGLQGKAPTISAGGNEGGALYGD